MEQTQSCRLITKSQWEEYKSLKDTVKHLQMRVKLLESNLEAYQSIVSACANELTLDQCYKIANTTDLRGLNDQREM